MFGTGVPGEDKHKKFKEVMGWVEDFLKPTGYAAGTDSMTVADIAWVATFRYECDSNVLYVTLINGLKLYLYSTVFATEHFDMSVYPTTNAWFEKIKGEIPNYEKACGDGAAVFREWFKAAKAKNQ